MNFKLRQGSQGVKPMSVDRLPDEASIRRQQSRNLKGEGYMSQAARNPHLPQTKKNKEERSNGDRKRKQFGGLLFLLIILATLFLMAWAIIHWMKGDDRLPLSKLVVMGERHFTTDDDIRQAILALGSPGSFMKQDVNVFQQQIERLPWIKQVSVRKQWPDELKIHLVEYVPIARWNDFYLLDNEGKIFSVPLTRLGNRAPMLLYGPEGTEHDLLKGYRAINPILASNNFTLKMAQMSARHSWQLVLDNDVRLELGRNDHIERLQRFIELYPLLEKQPDNNKKLNYIDLRYDTGVAVGWSSILSNQPNSHQQQIQAKQP
ncbi:Cell division septal protein [Candidatus Regiella insecticola 5.15]|uniref:Cell division protein FtsQ n=2 Tax=Candidatus Regiella insecticola TaxID=138073 RepID=G2GZI1_9ENTR|nr:Cell division septal protein [Candidatus Regiella insecticola 5.15]